MFEMDGESLGWLHKLAYVLGASEPALRLLMSLIIGYPLLYIHQKFLHHKRPIFQHIYFIAGGLGIALFNNGFNVIHSIVCIIFAWLLLLFIGGTLLSVIVSFTFQMGYLLIAYYVTGTDTYDIKWTMPQCVLTLRLIALSFDVWDGTKKAETLSSDQQKTALRIRPSLLEVAGHAYFPASFMVGPQFSMKRYLDFINRTLYPATFSPPVILGLMRGFYGLLYLAVYQIGIMFIPESYLISDPYMALSFWQKCAVVGIWGKIILYKYISCWLITEGACIFSGLAYSGQDKTGQPIWKGCANVRVYLYETGDKFGVLIQAFNTNTNAWVAQYVYKRLRFLNNRYLSQVGALLFLALWHGFHSGYYACFFMEFIIMYMEKNLESLLNKYPRLVSMLQSPPLSHVLYVFMKVYVIVFMGYCLGSFVLLKSPCWWKFYSSLYFVGHIFFGSWIIIEPLLKMLLRSLFNSSGERKSVDSTFSSAGAQVPEPKGEVKKEM